MTQHAPRIGVFGWGIVAPRSPDIDAFERNLADSESWLEPFNGFGPDNFLVGKPTFDFADYRDWLRERFPPNRFHQITSKLGMPTQFAIGSFIQSLKQNPGIEEVLKALGTQAHVYIGCGLGDLPSIYDSSVDHYEVQNRWDRHWSQPENNQTLAAYLDDPDLWQGPEVPPHPDDVEAEERRLAEVAWWRFWAPQSSQLATYLSELKEIEGLSVTGEVEAGKKALLRKKRTLATELQERWGVPSPPWDGPKAAGVIWNIHNTPASQVSMMGQIKGLTFAPVGACATFGLCLGLAMNAIRLGQAKAVVIGATDPPPHPLHVAGMYKARVISADGRVSKPLSEMRGTHISGGAATWIVGDYDYMTERGFEPVGLEPLSVGLSSDADHIITPSVEGPLLAMEAAIRDSRQPADNITGWDLHATATPGDYLEVENLRRVAPENVLVTARKGTFGHGLGSSGGFELTAQYLGIAAGRIHPTPLSESELNKEIAQLHRNFAFDHAVEAPSGIVGKLSMGVGGINSCVISRPWSKD